MNRKLDDEQILEHPEPIFFTLAKVDMARFCHWLWNFFCHIHFCQGKENRPCSSTQFDKPIVSLWLGRMY